MGFGDTLCFLYFFGFCVLAPYIQIATDVDVVRSLLLLILLNI